MRPSGEGHGLAREGAGIVAGPYTYAIGPVPEVSGIYQPPTGCISWIDLRSLGQQAALGQTGCGFFTMPSDWSVPGGYHGLGGGTGDLRELSFTLADQSAWTSLIGSTIPRDGSTKLIDALRLQLTDYAVPDGSSGPKPLQPGTPPPGPPPEADIFLGGHSLVWNSVAPRLGVGRWGSNLRDMLRADLQKHADTVAPGRSTEHWRKVLGAITQKYYGRWDDPREVGFLPPGLRGRPPANPGDPPGRRRKAVKPETTIADTFNRSDSGTLGTSSDGWSWTDGVTGWTGGGGGFEIVSNQCKANGTSGDARAETDLSSADHWAYTTLIARTSTTHRFGAVARFDASAASGYYAHWGVVFGLERGCIFKMVTGTETFLSFNADTVATSDVIETKVNGSTIYARRNSADKWSTTDTAVTGNTRSGLFCVIGGGTDATFDDFGASDGAASGGSSGNLLLLGVGA